MIGRMEDKRFMIRLTPNDILLNPSFFYKGESKEVMNRINEFNKEYDKRRGNQKIDTKSDENTEQSEGEVDTKVA